MYHLISLLSILFLLSCSSNDPQNELMKEAHKPNGKKIYNRYCVVCHGDEGKAEIGGAFDLSASKLTDVELNIIIKDGSENKKMRAFKEDLNDREIEAVIAHIKTLRK